MIRTINKKNKKILQMRLDIDTLSSAWGEAYPQEWVPRRGTTMLNPGLLLRIGIPQTQRLGEALQKTDQLHRFSYINKKLTYDLTNKLQAYSLSIMPSCCAVEQRIIAKSPYFGRYRWLRKQLKRCFPA